MEIEKTVERAERGTDSCPAPCSAISYGEWVHMPALPEDDWDAQVVTCFGCVVCGTMTGAEVKQKDPKALTGWRRVMAHGEKLKCQTCDGEGRTGYGGNCEAADAGDSYERCKGCGGLGFTVRQSPNASSPDTGEKKL